MEQADEFFCLAHCLLRIVTIFGTIIQFGYSDFRQVAVPYADKGYLAVHFKHAAHEEYAYIGVK